MSSKVALVVTGITAAATTGALALKLWSLSRQFRSVGSKHLQGFQLTRVLTLGENEVSLLGTFASDSLNRPAVVTIRKTAFDFRDLETLLRSLSLHTILENDIYSTFLGDVGRDVRPFKVDVIHPATETHIRKHSDQRFHVVAETKELYECVTLPFIENIPPSKLGWLYNILEHKTESERIVHEDCDPKNGFILLPDFKWSDPSNFDAIYCLAIVNDRLIRSVRDLRAKHLPLLKNVRDASLCALERLYRVKQTSIRVYVHYQPTYYHFHVHFSHVKISDGTQTGKAILLDDIIYNLSLDGDYYANASLTCVIGEMRHQPLYERFVERGVL